MTLSIVLRVKRTLDGGEIDKIISDLQARKALVVEHRRRDDWRKRELAAASFHAESSPECRTGVTLCARSAGVISDS